MAFVRGLVLSGFCLGLLACGLVGVWQTTSTPPEPTPTPHITTTPRQGGGSYGAYLAGTLARQNQDYPRAARYYETALQHDPNNIKLKTNLYLLQAVRGQFDTMGDWVDDMTAIQRPELLADYVAATLAMKRGEYGAVIDILADKPSYGLDTILVPILTAWAHIGLNQPEAADTWLNKLKNEKEAEPFYRYYKGLLALAEGDDAAADTAFRQMNDKGYPSLTALVFIRDFYEARGAWQPDSPMRQQFDKALAEQPAAKDAIRFLKAPTVTPAVGAAIAFYDVSVALGPHQLVETSLIFNELANYLTPTSTIPKIWGGEVFEGIGAYRQANAVYDRIQHPSDIILFKKAVNLIEVQDFAAARPILEDILKRNEMNPLILALLAESYSHTGHLREAVKLYQRALPVLQQLGQTKELGSALFALGTVYDDLGEGDLFEKTLLTALQVTPNNALVLNYLGYTWLEAGKNEAEAFDMVQKAHTLEPDDPHIMDSLALGYYRRGDYQKALELAERSTDLMPYSSIVYGRLGDIYAALGREREAAYQYRKALDLTTDLTPELKKDLTAKMTRLNTN